jgi:hypothetical protein
MALISLFVLFTECLTDGVILSKLVFAPGQIALLFLCYKLMNGKPFNKMAYFYINRRIVFESLKAKHFLHKKNKQLNKHHSTTRR